MSDGNTPTPTPSPKWKWEWPSPQQWETWILRTEIGVFLMAAIGLFFFAVTIKQAATVESLIPYVVAAFATGIIIWIFDFGRKQAQNAKHYKWVGHGLGVLVFILFGCLLLIGVIWFATFAFRQAGLLPPIPTPAQNDPVPDRFHIDECITYRDPKMTDEYFGPKNDAVARARIWMDVLERGAEQQLGTSTRLRYWLLSEPLKNYHGFTAQLHAGTSEGVVVIAYRVTPGLHPTFTPLWQVSGTGPASTYEFDVPSSTEGDKLVFLMAMKEETFKNLAPGSKFTVTSRTTSGAAS